MRFYVRKRRQPPGIIIVALIDILIVLLIFLMVTTTFKQQPALKLALPESSQSQKAGATENAPLALSIDPKGILRLGADARPVTLEGFRTQLLAQAATNQELQLSISADSNAPIGLLVRVYDATREAHIKGIHLNTKEPAKQ